MTAPDELQRAVQRLTEEARVAVECSWPWSVVLPSDLRLLLSERAELLAAVERMRGALEPFGRFIDVLETMGGNTPRTGTYASITTASAGEAELTIEDFVEARAALTTGEEK